MDVAPVGEFDGAWEIEGPFDGAAKESWDTEGALKNGATEGATDTEGALDGAAEGATDTEGTFDRPAEGAKDADTHSTGQRRGPGTLTDFQLGLLMEPERRKAHSMG